MSYFNNLTSLNQDQCYEDGQAILNEDIYKYNIPNFDVNRVNNSSRSTYFNSLNNVGMFEENKDTYFQYMPNETSLRNGQAGNRLTNTGDKTDKQADISGFVFPFQGYRYPDDEKIDIHSKLINGRLTHDKTSKRGQSINRFTPLLKEIREEIQNPVHIIPKYWIRGGQSSRSILLNIDYLKSCGIKNISH